MRPISKKELAEAEAAKAQYRNKYNAVILGVADWIEAGRPKDPTPEEFSRARLRGRRLDDVHVEPEAKL